MLHGTLALTRLLGKIGRASTRAGADVRGRGKVPRANRLAIAALGWTTPVERAKARHRFPTIGLVIRPTNAGQVFRAKGRGPVATQVTR